MAEAGCDPRWRAVVFVGPRASGKTTLARAVAAAAGLAFEDADDALAARVGMPAGQFLRDAGESAFRQREEEVVAELLAREARTVVALGGGAVLSAATRAALRAADVFVVHLDADPAELAARQRAAAIDRPALTGLGLEDEVRAVRTERAPLYREVADLELDTLAHGIDASVARVLEALHPGTPGSPRL